MWRVWSLLSVYLYHYRGCPPIVPTPSHLLTMSSLFLPSPPPPFHLRSPWETSTCSTSAPCRPSPSASHSTVTSLPSLAVMAKCSPGDASLMPTQTPHRRPCWCPPPQPPPLPPLPSLPPLPIPQLLLLGPPPPRMQALPRWRGSRLVRVKAATEVAEDRQLSSQVVAMDPCRHGRYVPTHATQPLRLCTVFTPHTHRFHHMQQLMQGASTLFIHGMHENVHEHLRSCTQHELLAPVYRPPHYMPPIHAACTSFATLRSLKSCIGLVYFANTRGFWFDFLRHP